jgi:hypothetical protein
LFFEQRKKKTARPRRTTPRHKRADGRKKGETHSVLAQTTPIFHNPNVVFNMSANSSSIFETVLHNDLEYLGERVIFAETTEDRLEHWKAFEVSEIMQ